MLKVNLRARVAAAAIAAVSCVAIQKAAAEVSAGDDEALKVIEETHDRNRKKFSAFTCRFQTIDGTSESLAGAIAGRIEDKLIRNGLWIVSPDEMRYELDCPPGTSVLKPPAGAPSGAKDGVFTEIDCLPLRELWSRKDRIAVSQSSILSAVNLHEQSGYTAVLNPLTLGVMGRGEVYSPAALIAGSRTGSRHCIYKGEVEENGTTLTVIETTIQSAEILRPVTTWYLDLAQGAIPIRVVFRDADGAKYGETRTLTVRRTPNAGFVAEKFLQTWTRDDRVAVISVTLVDLTLAPPLREQLAVTIEPGVQVTNVSDMRSAFRTTRAETMYADELAAWRKRCQESLQARLEENERRKRSK